jgi:hypothetical protein
MGTDGWRCELVAIDDGETGHGVGSQGAVTRTRARVIDAAVREDRRESVATVRVVG